MSLALNQSEMATLLDMARACQTLVDAKDVLDLFSKLEIEQKPQLRNALKRLPLETKKLLSAAANSKQGESAA